MQGSEATGRPVIKHIALRVAIFAMALAFASHARAEDSDASASSEHLIKAGYIFNFAKLVEWPAAAARKGQPMTIAVLGNDAFADVLAGVVSGKKIDDRPFVVKRLKNRDFKD